jgi:hypothetical protein
MKSLNEATFGQKLSLYSMYAAVMASFLGAFLAIGFGLTVGKILVGISIPVIVVSGIVSLLLFNLGRNSRQKEKQD